jgi:hypothetical protein
MAAPCGGRCLALAAALMLGAHGLAWSQLPSSGAAHSDIPPEVRRSQLVRANSVADHARQILLARKQGKGELPCYAPAALSERDLETLAVHRARLLAADRSALKAWIYGWRSAFKPSKDLDPLLLAPLEIPEKAPLNAFSALLRERTRAPLSHIRSVANLYQAALEKDADTGRLLEQLDFYIDLGLPVYLGQFGMPGDDEALLEMGKELQARTCLSPFETSAGAWQLAGRKVWNLAEKRLHIRDEMTVVNEAMKDPEVSVLVPALRALPPCRIAVVGPDFVTGLNWASPLSFTRLAAAVLASVNSSVSFRHFESPELTASNAYRDLLKEALLWKPATVLLIVPIRGDQDLDAFRKLGEELTGAGVKCEIFDDLHPPLVVEPPTVPRVREAAQSAGMTVIEVGRLLGTAPERGSFLSLDGVHMTEVYHRLMAKQWLRFLAGSPAADLPSR